MLHLCCWQYGFIFIQIIVDSSKNAYMYFETECKMVIDFGNNRKHVCNFLLVFNSNFDTAMLQFSGFHFRFLAIYGQWQLMVRVTVRDRVRVSTDCRSYFYIPNTCKVYFTMAKKQKLTKLQHYPLVLSCPISEILQVFWWEEQPRPYNTRILGCSPWTRMPMWPRGAKTRS